MDQNNFFVQGVFKGGADVGRLEFYFQRGTDHVLYEPNSYPPSDGIGARWIPDETVYATTDELPRKIIMEYLSGPDGYLNPGDYKVVLESYNNATKKWNINPIKTIDERAIQGVITVNYEFGKNTAQCRIEESTIIDLLLYLTRQSANHKNLRFPDRYLALSQMFGFIDFSGVRRCGLRYASAMTKLMDQLNIGPTIGPSIFRQVRQQLDLTEFRERLKNASAIIAFYELRDWLNVQDETLRKWLIKIDLATPKFHGRSYNITVKQFMTTFVPFLISIIDSSPAGQKIDNALRHINCAP